MPSARPVPQLLPRMLSGPQVAAYLGRSGSWFLEHRCKLEAQGFPGPVAPLGLWDRKAIDLWLDRQGGLSEPAAAPGDAYDSDWMEACRDG